MLRTVHRTAAGLSTGLVLSFWLSSEGTALWWPQAHPTARLWILAAIPLLVTSIVVAGTTGRRLAKGRRDPALVRKRRLTVGLAVNGLFVLTPCAIWLRNGGPDDPLATLEGVAGGVQLVLLATLIGHGRALRSRRRTASTQAPASEPAEARARGAW